MHFATHPIIFITLAISAAFSAAAETPLPAPWQHQDIGVAKVTGTAEQADGVFTLQGALDLWGVADGCHFAFQPVHGDVELSARVTKIDNPGGVNHAKASLCLRESLDPGARSISLCVTPADGTQFIYRDKPAGKTTRIFPTPEAQKTAVPKGQFPCWLKLVRQGNKFTGYESIDGEKWQVSGEIELELPPDACIGLAASSHKKDILTKATFDHVRIGSSTSASRPAP